MAVQPFRVARGTTSPLDSLQLDLNAMAGRGFPMAVTLEDGYVGSKSRHAIVPSGTLWGTTNTTGYAANGSTMVAPTTVTVGVDTLVAVPFFHESGHGIATVGFRVGTGAANAKAVFGVYDSTDEWRGDAYPRAKLWQSTERTPTANNTAHEESANLILKPGRLYWIAYHCGTAAPTISASALDGVDQILGWSTGGGGAPTQQTYLSGSRTYSATLPSIYPSGQTAVATVPPFLYYRYDQNLQQSFQRSYPIWSPSVDGWVVRNARLVSHDTVRGGPSRPRVTVSVRVKNATGATTIGSFDSTTDVLTYGKPLYLTDPDEDAALAKDSILEAYVEQTGWPLLSVAGVRVCCDLAREKP